MGNSSSAQGLGGETQGVKVTVKERYHAYLPKHINLNAVLTAEKVRLIHAHWTFIADEVRVACLLVIVLASCLSHCQLFVTVSCMR